MTLRDQLLGIDSSVYDQLGGKPLMNLNTGGGPISSFDPFNVPSNTPSDTIGGLPNFLSGMMGGAQPPLSQGPGMPAPVSASPAATPTDSSLRGIASIPPDIRSQLTKADLSDLPVNLLTGELSATPQKDMGFITVNPQGPHSDAAYNLPLNFQPPQFEQVSAGESPAWRNLTTGEIGPMPDPNFDPGLGNFTSASRNSFLQGGGGSTFDLLPAGKFGNPDTAFMSPKGFWDWSSSPLSMFGSLLGGSLGIAGGFPGFAGLLAGKLSGNPLVGIGTKALTGLLG